MCIPLNAIVAIYNYNPSYGISEYYQNILETGIFLPNHKGRPLIEDHVDTYTYRTVYSTLCTVYNTLCNQSDVYVSAISSRLGPSVNTAQNTCTKHNIQTFAVIYSYLCMHLCALWCRNL